ncbi:MAG: DinB family protein [Planctomycetes bacterium]|nr:DinB family protein [Planctomycetota bacterium]NUQ33950.1 DinB family protein [Planctomycetaceae bacterium]
MKHVADELDAIITEALPVLKRMTAKDAEIRYAPGKWSRKEFLGHLIDSALNNLQRIIRLQIDQNLPATFPGYDADKWVTVGGYHDMPWDDVIELWARLNRLFASDCRRAKPETFNRRWISLIYAADGSGVTLQWIAEDYVRHLRHHLHQVVPHHFLEFKYPA